MATRTMNRGVATRTMDRGVATRTGDGGVERAVKPDQWSKKKGKLRRTVLIASFTRPSGERLPASPGRERNDWLIVGPGVAREGDFHQWLIVGLAVAREGDFHQWSIVGPGWPGRMMSTNG